MSRIVEVGPRDGLQNEAASLPVDVKVAFVDALSEAGLTEIEAGAFVSPKAVPQLADSEEVFRRIRRAPGVTYSALVPNEKGLDRALHARADKVAVFTAASETFNRRNINATIAESMERFRPVVSRARAGGLPVRAYVSTAFWCPYEGRVPIDAAADVVRRLLDLGVSEISVGDTIGKAVPEEVGGLLDLLLSDAPPDRFALHFHDTYGRAIENLKAAYAAGIRTFDSSVGGLGGCPFAPGASGNVSTEAVAEALRALGDDPGIRGEALAAARSRIGPALGRAL